VRNDRQLFLRAAGDDKLQDFAFARSQSMGALIAAMSNRAVPIAVQILGGGPGQSWFGPDEWRLRVRNHGAVVGAPMGPRVVSAPLRWRCGGCLSRAGVGTIVSAPPSPSPSQPLCAVPRASASAVSSPLIAATVAKTIIVVRNIGCSL
jgi:hypothetical protein